MKPEQVLTVALSERPEPVLYSVSYPLRKNEDGEETERIFFYLDVSAPGAGNPYLELKMTHVRRRTEEEMVEGMPEKIWKKVRGEESKFALQILGTPSWLFRQAARDWLEETLTADGESDIWALLPDDAQLSPIRLMLNQATLNNQIQKTVKDDPQINGKAVVYEIPNQVRKIQSAFSFNLPTASPLRNDF